MALACRRSSGPTSPGSTWKTSEAVRVWMSSSFRKASIRTGPPNSGPECAARPGNSPPTANATPAGERRRAGSHGRPRCGWECSAGSGPSWKAVPWPPRSGDRRYECGRLGMHQLDQGVGISRFQLGQRTLPQDHGRQFVLHGQRRQHIDIGGVGGFSCGFFSGRQLEFFKEDVAELLAGIDVEAFAGQPENFAFEGLELLGKMLGKRVQPSISTVIPRISMRIRTASGAFRPSSSMMSARPRRAAGRAPRRPSG